jgi:hypothetical protein
MRNILKVGVALLVVIVMPLAGCFGINATLNARATPPPDVVDVASCLNWLKRPMGVYRVRSGGLVYYQVIGPAGRLIASGPAGYAFDGSGAFIGWSPDIGDVKLPSQIFTAGRKVEQISIEELQKDTTKKHRSKNRPET